MLAELDRLGSLMREQGRAIEALRAQVAAQASEIDRLRGTGIAAAAGGAEPAPGRAAAIAIPAAPGEHAALRRPAAPVPGAAPQPSSAAARQRPPEAQAKRWYEKYAFRGYTQFRYNRLHATNDGLACEQCDASIGGDNGFFIRRSRFILSGDVTNRIALYFQPDFASTAGNSHFGQIRDLYFDVALDRRKEFRFRVGQSKVPFGFENLQSSQNRAALDRTDAINSATPNERDLGVFFYWAPERIRKRFTHLVSSGLKGSGDYGVFGTGAFNGQSTNRAEANDSRHYVVRLAYPFELPNGQFLEAGIQAYTGRYAVISGQRAPTTLGARDFPDRRAALSFVLYPQPFGFQAEYNFGRGPRYHPSAGRIEDRRLGGGYAQMMYRSRFRGQAITPFLRYQYYSGGKKQEFDARSYLVREQSLGLEWQANSFLEFVGEYVYADRTFEDSRLPNNRQKGRLLRLQMQVNY